MIPMQSQSIDLPVTGLSVRRANEGSQLPASIQGDRCLIVLGDDLDRVLFSSTNAGAMLFGFPDEQSLLNGSLFADLFPDTVGHKLRNALASAGSFQGMGLCYACEIGGRDFDVIAHSIDGYRIFEFEPSDGRDTIATLELGRALQQRLARLPSIEKLATQVPQFLRTFTGYDRVVVSRLSADGSATVLGETFHPNIQGLQDAVLPPRLVSEVLANASRSGDVIAVVIADIDAEPVPVLPIADMDLEPLDLSRTCAQSARPETAAALRDMGMAACAFAVIQVDREPWGMIAAFHAAPRSLSLPQRVAVEMLAGIIAQRVDVLEMREVKEISRHAHRDVAYALATPPLGEGEIGDFLTTRLPLLTEVMGCDGAGLWLNGAWHAHGETPLGDDLTLLREVPRGADHAGVWVETEGDRGLAPTLDAPSRRAAVLIVGLSRICDDRLIFFRSMSRGSAASATDPARIWKDTDIARADALRCATLELLADHRRSNCLRDTE
jgi:light-regulated signal transduction histidine kinase (bacteriophytochrome)